jgi:hypothetical protein
MHLTSTVTSESRAVPRLSRKTMLHLKTDAVELRMVMSYRATASDLDSLGMTEVDCLN